MNEFEINLDIQTILHQVNQVTETIEITQMTEEIVLDAGNKLTIYKDGAKIGSANALDFIAGTNTTLTITKSGNKVNITITTSGGVTGPSPSTDNAIARFNGITGSVLQNSLVIIDDSGNITLPNGMYIGTSANNRLYFDSILEIAELLANASNYILIDGANNDTEYRSGRHNLFTVAANTNTSWNVLIKRKTSGTPATGIGSGISLITETSTNNQEIGSTIESISTSIVVGAESFDLVFKNVNSSSPVPAEVFRFSSFGGFGIGGANYGTARQALLSGGSAAAPSWTTIYEVLRGTASGTDTYVVTISGVSAYTSGDAYIVNFTNANTGSSTININSLGAKTLKKSVSTNLASGDILAGQEFLIVYDGTNFQVIGLGGGGGTPGGTDTQVQFNDSSAFGGDGGFTYNKTTNKGTIGSMAVDDDAYDSTGWNANLDVPTKNAVRDKIETLAPLASPTFTGTPIAPTAAINTNTTQIATTEFVQTQLNSGANLSNVGAKLYLFNAY